MTACLKEDASACLGMAASGTWSIETRPVAVLPKFPSTLR